MNAEEANKRIAQLEKALMLMVYQYCVTDGRLDHRFMCAGEHAFAVLGLQNRDHVEKLEKMLHGTEHNPASIHLSQLPTVKNLAGMSRYARIKGISVRYLTEEEKNQFGVFTKKC